MPQKKIQLRNGNTERDGTERAKWKYECQRHSGAANLSREYDKQLQHASGCERVTVDQVARSERARRGEEDRRRC